MMLESQLSSQCVWSMNSEIAGCVWLLHGPSVPRARPRKVPIYQPDSRFGKYNHTHTHTHHLTVGHRQVQHQQNVVSTRAASPASVFLDLASHTDTGYTLDQGFSIFYMSQTPKSSWNLTKQWSNIINLKLTYFIIFLSSHYSNAQ